MGAMPPIPKPRQTPLHFGWRDLLAYLRYDAILARVIHDQSVIPQLARLSGRALELGAGRHDYSTFAPLCSEYIRSDFKPPKGDPRIAIDATAIAFPDASFDAVVCMSTLEHIQAYDKVLAEVWRVLKPGGRFLLCVPWVFPWHGAPDDYHRFSATALRSMLSGYELETFEAVGNHWLTQAMFLQRPTWSRTKAAAATRWYDLLLRLVGIAFLLAGRGSDGEDDNYALLYTCVGVKPAA